MKDSKLKEKIEDILEILVPPSELDKRNEHGIDWRNWAINQLLTLFSSQRSSLLKEIVGIIGEDEPEHFASSKNSENMGKNNLKAQLRNNFRHDLLKKIRGMK